MRRKVENKADKVMTQAPEMTIARAVLLGLMRRYLAGMMDPSVSLLEIHKLIYFMQESGEQLELKYSGGTYGPYAENLRHVLSAIEGHFISGYGDAEDDPEKPIELNVEAAERAEAYLRDYPETQARFDRVANLIDGFETPFGMELLATVHWIAHRENAANVSDIAAIAYDWNDRKRMFKARHMQIAWELLDRKGWLPK
jgi:hypothetical protein